MRKSMQLKAVAFAAAAALMGVSGMASASEAAQTAPSTFKPGTYTDCTGQRPQCAAHRAGDRREEPHRKDRLLQES